MAKISFMAAAVQYESRYLEKAYNKEQLIRLTKEAVKDGAKLVVLPEMGTTGYYFDERGEIEALAEPVPQGETSQAFLSLAKELNCYIVVGLAEKEGGRLYNTCFLAGPEGYWGKHRKIQPFTPDTLWADNGNEEIKVFKTPIGRISMEICMDVSFPEAPRTAALLGAQILCSPMNWCEPVIPSAIWIARAFENHLYFLASNRQGVEKGYTFSGGSSVIDPEGNVLDCVMQGEGYALARLELDPGEENSLPVERRPALYGELLLQRYHWLQNQFYETFARPRIPDGGKIGITVVNMAPQNGGLLENLSFIEEAVRAVEKTENGFVIFPEYALNGRPSCLEEAKELSQKEDGEALRRLSELAKMTGVNLMAGFVLEEENALYSAVYLALPDGSHLLYKKSHLDREEKAWAHPGEQTGLVIDLPCARVGILMGKELFVTEAVRLLANKGCDVIAVPASIKRMSGAYPQWSNEACHWHLGRVRANENNTVVAVANTEGTSGIFGPDMFKLIRDEVITEEPRKAVSLSFSTEPFIAGQDGGITVNPIREKMMLTTRLVNWYEPLLK